MTTLSIPVTTVVTRVGRLISPNDGRDGPFILSYQPSGVDDPSCGEPVWASPSHKEVSPLKNIVRRLKNIKLREPFLFGQVSV